MKIPRRNEIGDYEQALIKGSLMGAAYGGAISFGLYSLLKRKTTVFQQAGVFHKSLLIVGPVAFAMITNMEFASRNFEIATRKEMAHSAPTGQTGASAPVNSTKSVTSMSDFMSLHKYKIVLAGWAMAMGGSFAVVNRDKLMTRSQKIVQARVYAQGITVAMLLATVFLSVSSKEDERKSLVEKARSSWSRDLQYVKGPAGNTSK